MRVLHVHSGNLFGGVETMMLTQVRHQHLCPSLEFEFALCFDGRFRDELKKMAAPVYDLGAVRLRHPLTVHRARRKFEQLRAREKFDVIVTHSCWTQAVFGPRLKLANVPLVFYLHAPPNGHWLERTAKRTSPDLIICNSTYSASSASALYANVAAEVIYCPVSPHVISDSIRDAKRVELETSEDATVVVQVGRMEWWKGFDMHLKALAELNQVPGWVCWIVGGAQHASENKYFDELKTLARQLGIASRVRFLGQRDDVNDLLAAADVFCQPNIGGEPFGITFIEAMYARLPVVTSDIGAAREIVDDTCGVRVSPGDVGSLAQELRRLIQIPELRARLGNGGASRAEQLCDPKTQLNKFLNSISSLTHPCQAIA